MLRVVFTDIIWLDMWQTKLESKLARLHEIIIDLPFGFPINNIISLRAYMISHQQFANIVSSASSVLKAIIFKIVALSTAEAE